MTHKAKPGDTISVALENAQKELKEGERSNLVFNGTTVPFGKHSEVEDIMNIYYLQREALKLETDEHEH